MIQERRFPIFLSLLTLLTTAAALALAVFGIHWGALARPDVLNLSATYVFESLLAVAFLAWPALRTSRAFQASQFLLDYLTILVSALPATVFAWWFSEYSWPSADGTVLLLGALVAVAGALLALTSQLSQPGRILAQSLLLFWYLGSLMAQYLNAEFAPSLSDSWSLFAPASAVYPQSPLGSVLTPVILFWSLALLLVLAVFFVHRRFPGSQESASTQLI